MRAITKEQNAKLRALGYNGLGVIKCSNGEIWWTEVHYLEFEQKHPIIELSILGESAVEWLREKHDLSIEVHALDRNTYFYDIYKLTNNDAEKVAFQERGEESDSYDESLKLAIDAALNLLEPKTKKSSLN